MAVLTSTDTIRPNRGGRPRDPSRDGVIRKAILRLLADVGYGALTMDAVASQAGVGLFQPGDDPQGRRLAGGAGAEQAEELPGGDVQIDAAEGFDLSVTLGDAGEPKIRHLVHRHPACFRSPPFPAVRERG